jgi:hypothetical protein
MTIPALTAVLAALLATAAGPDKPFRTEVTPRIDPVFGDAATLREQIDQFLALQAEMATVRDEFSAAVHKTLAQLGPVGGAAPTTCPANVPASYATASDAGRRFLALGRRFAARFRDIRRAEDLGDTVGLTPDYRAKAKKARDLYAALVRDYREMRAAFYEQLTAEVRHAGCKLPAPGKPVAAAPAADHPPDPTNASDWVLDPPEEAAEPGPGKSAAAPKPSAADKSGGPAIWIQIDNTRCTQRSALTIDGVAIGDIAAGKKIPVRTHAGPHELCVLPARDKQTCGAAGTVRRAYLYDGWTLSVRCGN